MKQNQSVNENLVKATQGSLGVDMLLWRVNKLRKHHAEAALDRVYNDRPRLRDETHH